MTVNTLDKSTSPYLLPHKDNPVAWRSWGADALAEAKAAGQAHPPLLGYAGCHWCHVMNQESFADPEIAALINENFIPVLVDRDERPDVDMLYQAAAGIMGHAGGWPLNMFLIAEGVPFWVAAISPRRTSPDRPGFRPCCPRDCRSLLAGRARARAQDTGAKVKAAVENLYNRDMRGGAGSHRTWTWPRCASPSVSTSSLAACWAHQIPHPRRCWKCCGAPSCAPACRSSASWSSPPWTACCSAASTTMSAAASSATPWTSAGMEPHFEKMLYDKALDDRLLHRVWQFNRNELCRQRVDRDHRLAAARNAGGRCASPPRSLPAPRAKTANITSGARRRSTPPWSALSRPASSRSMASRATAMCRAGTSRAVWAIPCPPMRPTRRCWPSSAACCWQRARSAPRPPATTSVLTDWNGLAIRALARAGSVFERPDWIAAARQGLRQHRQAAGRRRHAFPAADRACDGFADDYANMARAALQLWEVTGEQRYSIGGQGVDELDDHFWNEARDGYYFTADDAEPLIVRVRAWCSTSPRPPPMAPCCRC